MSSVTYWKCNKAVSDELRKAWSVHRSIVRQAKKLAKEFGAIDVYIGYGVFGDPEIVGFQFKDPVNNPPDKKLFYKMKDVSDGFHFRKKTELEKQISELNRSDKVISLAMRLVGIKSTLIAAGDGFCLTRAGLAVREKAVYISTNGKPTKNCTRISDMEFEKISKSRSK